MSISTVLRNRDLLVIFAGSLFGCCLDVPGVRRFQLASCRGRRRLQPLQQSLSAEKMQKCLKLYEMIIDCTPNDQQ
jgi:hypothetical protein